jgi:hypothetical protein
VAYIGPLSCLQFVGMHLHRKSQITFDHMKLMRMVDMMIHVQVESAAGWGNS